jgi:murein DD-endopeptidase MepM/ murein hydrolase activator NlpD
MHDAAGLSRPVAHRGVDVGAPAGTPVLAGADGEAVKVAESATDGTYVSCGKYVVLQHEVPSDLIWPTTTYCHLRQATVKQGDRVRRGDVIGYVGTTGWRRPDDASPHTHVHWELMRARLEDPLQYAVGCFEPQTTYPAGRLVLTYPVGCK